MTDAELIAWLHDAGCGSDSSDADILHKSADRLEKLTAVLAAADDCAVSRDNPDTCGVCHLHFAECDAERAIFADDWDEGRHDKDFPSCAGGRLRITIQRARQS